MTVVARYAITKRPPPLPGRKCTVQIHHVAIDKVLTLAITRNALEWIALSILRSTTRPTSRSAGNSARRYRPGPEEQGVKNAMFGAIPDDIREISEFDKFDIRSVDSTDRLMVRFGVDSFSELRSATSGHRAHFVDEAKKSYQPPGFKSPELTHGTWSLFRPLKRGRYISPSNTMRYNSLIDCNSAPLIYLPWPERSVLHVRRLTLLPNR